MEEIERLLKEIIKNQLEICNDKKEVPSRDLLDTIQIYLKINFVNKFKASDSTSFTYPE